ncbi:hypothetical protein QQF64_000629 [Cirrhinus molitorella]|uniref:PBZ-type domain-containing protein n=1 Tax=Cirrhinus molitorella TaxID=172907 RepID=A0ABR3NZ73_9TELE
MPGFELEQVDGGSPIELPYGETILGRGPFLGVNDKRVSRNHGILENLNGQLRLKPTHLNPCFIQTNIVAQPQPLEKDQWHCLKEGDIFSLMPGKYIYRVHVKEEDQTPRNSQAFEEEMEVEKCSSGPAAPSLDSATLEANSYTPMTPSATLAEHKGAGDSSHTLCSLNEAPTKSQQDESDVPQKKRILPAWMLTSAKGESSAVKATPTKSKRVATPKRAAAPKRARATRVSSEEEEEEEEEEEMPKRKAKRLKSDSENESEPLDDATAPKSSRVGSVPDGANGTGVMERDDGERRGGDRGAEDRAGAQAEHSQAQAEDPSDSQASQGWPQRSKITESKTSSSKVKKQGRTPCAYGSSCYRKNPVHFQECSHPGDSDYEEEETEDADDDRPECPYGTHCYRKNLLHKKDFKHTKSPPKTAAADEDEDEDEDHYENSFINDESEEEEEEKADEDSDYVPESDDSGKEDIKRLQKEAKAFLRRKK